MNLKTSLIKKYQENKELANSFKWRLTQILFKQGTTAVMFFVGTYFLSKEQMGIYNYITSILLLLSLITDFGISTSTSRYIALYKTQSKEKVKKVFFNSTVIIFTVSVLIIFFLLLFKNKLPIKHFQYLLYTLPLILISPLVSLMDGIYRGLKQFKKLALTTVISSILGFSFSYFLIRGLGLKGSLLSPLCFFSIHLLFLLIQYKEYGFKIEKKILKEILNYALFFGIATIGHYFFSKVNILILSTHNLWEEIAIYELLNKIYVALLIPFVVLGQILAPVIVELFAKERRKEILPIFRKLLLSLSVFFLLFLPLSMILTYWGIGIFFSSYMGDILSSVLLPVALTNAVAGIVVVISTGLIASTGHAKIIAYQNIITGVINLFLNIYLINTYGFVAIVWGTFIVQFLSSTILFSIYHLKLRKLY